MMIFKFSVKLIKKLEGQHWLIMLQIHLLQLNCVSELFAPTERKVARDLQELSTAFLPVTNKYLLESG